MKSIQNLKKQFIIFAFVCCAWVNTAQAYNQSHIELGLDGTKTTVAAWRVLETGRYKLQAAYGTGAPWTPVDITAVATESVIDYPILAASKDSTATTRAAVTWLSNDIATSIKNLRVSFFNGTTWSAPVTISSGLASETVRSDYLIAISDDGLTISVIWTAFLTTVVPNQNAVRSAISTDGGATWGAPSTIALTGSVF